MRSARRSRRGVLCGRKHAPAAQASIVDGSGASIAEFPFQVALYNPRAGSPAKGFFCGGVILDATRRGDRRALPVRRTRAAQPAGEIEVLAGSTYLEPTDPGSVRDPVAAATVDPAYNPATSDYDVGVLRLARPLWSGPAPALDGQRHDRPAGARRGSGTRARRSRGPRRASASQAASAPAPAVVSGWGDLNPEPGGAPSYPLRLRKARVPLVATGLCEEAYATIEQAITPRMICAGGGAPGGPGGTGLLLRRQRRAAGGRRGASGSASPAGDVLLGLVDFGNGCAQAGYPGRVRAGRRPRGRELPRARAPRSPRPGGSTAASAPSARRSRRAHTPRATALPARALAALPSPPVAARA